LNKPPGNNSSPIRRIGKDEKAAHANGQRKWPEKKHLASEHPSVMPKPGEKNRIQSVLIALPVVMLVIGLAVYFRGESAQNNGAPVLSEMVSREVVFKSVSEVSGIGKPKYYLWYTSGDSSRGVRTTAPQQEQLANLSAGDVLNLELAPRVAGSNTLWAYRVFRNGALIVDGSSE